MKLMNQLLLIKMKPKQQHTEGGLALPDTAQEPPREGILIAFADDCKNNYPKECIVGFADHATMPYEKELIFIHERDVRYINP